jgi:hypothetical protein
MTRSFNVYYTCQHCGKQTTAETGFGRWMRAQPKLDSADGIVRTDTDHTILRYKTDWGRERQLLMDIEVKEFGSYPNDSQRDLLAMKHQLMSARGKNMHGATTQISRKIYSMMNGRKVSVRYLGLHLLVFEKTSPCDSVWIHWDKKPITEDQLLRLLAFDLDPNNPVRSMRELLRDRHFQSAMFDFSVGESGQ